MSKRLRQYLYEHYTINGNRSYKKLKKDYAIQIDDQDDTDPLNQFCNIFVTVGGGNIIEIELCGNVPMTKEISDFAEIYSGMAYRYNGRIVLRIAPRQIEALIELAHRIRDTAGMGETVGNPGWEKMCARTISSLYRFVRIIKEYQGMRTAGLA